MRSNIVEMRSVTKEFNRIPVLEQVNFELRKGEVHALLGENGAGKSTLMKILCGVYQPDGGEIRIQGNPVKFDSSNESRASGIAMVFQEFSLIPSLTVAQNIFLMQEAHNRFGLFDLEIGAQRIDMLGPVVGDEQPLVAFRAIDLEAEHLVQLALEEGRGRDDVFDRR